MQVKSIPIGNVIARIVYLTDTDEGRMTSKEAYELLGIRHSTYSHHISSVDGIDKTPDEFIEELRNETTTRATSAPA